MAEKHLHRTLDAQQKIKNDHELFLEAYEKPTQIYRFLKARHSLEPIFLQRNLSYMKTRNSRKRLISRKRKVNVGDLLTKTKNKTDLSLEIKSDSQLRITFDSLVSEKTGNDDNNNSGTDNMVEVLLYRFKQLSPEMLITNPTSVPCDCTVLGKCLIPNTNNVTTNNQNCTVTIPGSVLSWKGTGGVLGTHMLVFRVTPLTNEESLQFQLPYEKRHARKRKISDSHQISNGKFALNGYRIHANNKPDDIVDSNNIHEQNCIENKNDSLQCQDPKGPPPSSNTAATNNCSNNLIISVPRRPSEVSPPLLKARNRRTRVQLLIDGDKPKNLCPKWDSLPVVREKEEYVLAKQTRSNTGTELEEVTGSASLPIPRKRVLSDSNSLEPAAVDAASKQISEHIVRDPCSSPPSKQMHIDHELLPLEFDMNSDGHPVHCLKMYYAELVAFDSRQDCLLVDGSYDLSLKEYSINVGPGKEKGEIKNGRLSKSLPFDWDTIFEKSPVNDTVMSTEIGKGNTFLRFSIVWSAGPPKARSEDTFTTGLDFLKLRNEYKDIISSFSNEPTTSQLPPPPTLTPKPTIFNFLYNKNTLQQTELKHNYVCPWCSLDCKQLYSQLKHMSLCHPRFLFTYSPVEGGGSVDVRINKTYESGTLDPSEKLHEETSLQRKKYPTKCKPFTSVFVKTKTKEKEDLSEFTIHSKQVTKSKHKPSRLFYHTHTCLPMISNEKDSDDDEVDQWLKLTSSRMVDEFIDVNQGEKQFMKIWNLFIMEHKIIADKQVSNICLLFAKEKKSELVEKHIVYNFISHVIYICDIGLIPTTTLSEVISIMYNP